MQEYCDPQEVIPEQATSLSDLITISRETWMANQLTYDDIFFITAIREVVLNLPEKPTMQQIATAVKEFITSILSTIDPDIEKVQEVLSKNRAPLIQRFLSGDTPMIGEYFNPNSYSNLCQQNVLLLSAIGAIYGYTVYVVPFIYTGKTSKKERDHAVALWKDETGNEFIMDPTLMVTSYGDVTFLEKQDYLNKFTEPNLGKEMVVFSPN